MEKQHPYCVVKSARFSRMSDGRGQRELTLMNAILSADSHHLRHQEGSDQCSDLI